MKTSPQTRRTAATLRSIALHAALALCAAFACFCALRLHDKKGIAAQAPVSAHFLSMGTVAAATFYESDIARAEEGAEIAKTAFSEVENDLSIFSADSLISLLNTDGEALFPAPVGPTDFSPAKVVAAALDAARDTGGAFDPTVDPLMQLWGFRKEQRTATPPSDTEIAAALEKVGWESVAVAAASDGFTRISFAKPGMRLDLGGIAKGYAVDLAFERLRAAGFHDFLIDLGGNIRVSGRPAPDREEWVVAIRDPGDPSRITGENVLLHDGEAVATSGSYERYVEIGGKRYSHIVDPRTGHPATRQGSVSVVAPTAMKADAYSTAFFVEGKGAASGGATVFRWSGASLTEHVREAR